MKLSRPRGFRAFLTYCGMVLVPAVFIYALVAVARYRKSQIAEDSKCINNLSQLWKMQGVYQAKLGGPMKLMPKDTGKAFWLALSDTDPALVPESAQDIYVCPKSGETPGKDVCTYRGPKSDVNTLGEGTVVGVCDDGGHPGEVLILYKGGRLEVEPRGGKTHRMALDLTTH